MQLLICPGYHSPGLTRDFLQALLGAISVDALWIWPTWAAPDGLNPLSGPQAPDFALSLRVIGFSAGVVTAYPLLMAWQLKGGTGQLIAIDGWGMPLPGISSVYRMSHDYWTHCTTYLPSPRQSQGYFYADPAVDHLTIWQQPHRSRGMGAVEGTLPRPTTALQFICDALTQG